MLPEICTSPDQPEADSVRVKVTHLGQAVFANRGFPGQAIIGEITGPVTEGDSGMDEYTFEFSPTSFLTPVSPFRFLNHSCNPNCEFEVFEEPSLNDQPARPGLYLSAIRDIQPGEELTIAYNWPAECAIPCQCNDQDCVGWVVDHRELDLLES